VDDDDVEQCEMDVRNFLKTKRKATNWKLAIQVVALKAGEASKRSHEDDSSMESKGQGRKKAKVSANKVNRTLGYCMILRVYLQQTAKSTSTGTSRHIPLTERDETEEQDMAAYSLRITVAHLWEKHPANTHGCFVNPNGQHVTLTAGILNYWAGMLKNEALSITVYNAPAPYFFNGSGACAALEPKYVAVNLTSRQCQRSLLPSQCQAMRLISDIHPLV
jgi:hypothetical protein